MPDEERLGAARAAVDACDWATARELLGGADREQGLGPEDVDRLAWSRFFTGDIDGCLEGWQRAFAAWVRAGDAGRAGLAAVHLALTHFARGSGTVGAGWLAQAGQRLDPHPDSSEFAWLEWLRTMSFAESGADRGEALARAEALCATARRLGNLDVEMLGTLMCAQLQVRSARTEAAAGLFDQIMALTTTGLLGPLATSFINCGTISACTDAGDYERAWAWIAEVERSSPGPPARADFPGDCRMHRAELLRLRGDWSSAEITLAGLCELVGGWHTGHAGTAYTELGLISLRRGDLEAAATAYARAQELGGSAQPGLTELALARGEFELAATSIRAALAAAADDPCAQARMMPVAVDAALATGDVGWALELAGRLEQLADDYPATARRARAAQAVGAAAAARGEHAAAAETLGRARALWESCPAPYEAACTRVVLAAALQAGGDHVGHGRELGAAFDAFTRLGAVRDARRIADLLGRPMRTDRVERALMFTDVEGSTALLARLGDAAWIGLLREHDAALRQAFAGHHGMEVHQKGGGDGFFAAFGSASAGLDCALDIQRRMRARAGPLVVRIGVHWATVTHAEGDFSGRGVHEAARIAALAQGGEILTSTVALAAAGGSYPVGPARTVELRGLPGTAEVRNLLVGGDGQEG